MKRFDLTKALALSLACFGLVLPHPAVYAAGPKSVAKAPVMKGTATKGTAAKMPVISDVALGSGGTFQGKVVDGQGIALDGAPVSVRLGGREVAALVSDRDGKFEVANLRGGSYHVVAGEGQGLYRAWAPNTAPPSATTEAVVVSNAPDVVIRGQSEGDMQNWNDDLAYPEVDYVKIGAFALAGIAGGFAISEAVSNNNTKDENSNLQQQNDLLRAQRDALLAQINNQPASP